MNYALVVEPTRLKHISQIGSFPQVGVKMQNIWNHDPDYIDVTPISKDD